MTKRIEDPEKLVPKIAEALRRAGISAKVYAEGKVIHLEKIYYPETPETDNFIRQALQIPANVGFNGAIKTAFLLRVVLEKAGIGGKLGRGTKRKTTIRSCYYIEPDTPQAKQ
ncbi:MAG: hypothetical protein KatS3mg033_0659 [Thermonema sp.]|uniref:hypothetical protein n=1 Tax=Thermonema TaxID=28194 RepID=UPI00056EA9CE|nr:MULTISPECIES: hypothetical protein [Thermonema]GIV38859.1 MAG: hypothetical protein KatS3mg033_0659 [Thermonema sp.]